jgi:DNA-binding transcriptional MerR regulator
VTAPRHRVIPRSASGLIPIEHASRSAGISTARARWYADKGLLGHVARSEGNLRELTDDQIKLLGDIAEWRRRDLSLREIDALMRARRGDSSRLRSCLREAAGALARRAAALVVLVDAATRPEDGAD